jgi:hypothetical protein
MAVQIRRSDRLARDGLRSPGRPKAVRRDDERGFWDSIAAGRSSEDAAAGAAVSRAVGTRWFREAGGMLPSTLTPSSTPVSGRYLSFAEREELAILHAQSGGVREIARQMGRSASTISQELRRNVAKRSGGVDYRAITAQCHAERAARRPKAAKLTANPALRRMCKTDWVAWSSHRAGLRFPGRCYPGTAVNMDLGRICVGLQHGARNRLPID